MNHRVIPLQTEERSLAANLPFFSPVSIVGISVVLIGFWHVGASLAQFPNATTQPSAPTDTPFSSSPLSVDNAAPMNNSALPTSVTTAVNSNAIPATYSTLSYADSSSASNISLHALMWKLVSELSKHFIGLTFLRLG